MPRAKARGRASRSPAKPKPVARPKPTTPAPASGPLGDGLGVERYQWMRSCPEQSRGDQLEIRPLTEAAFRQYVRPQLRAGYADSLAAYLAKHPTDRFYAVVRRITPFGSWGEWEPNAPVVGSLADLRPDSYKSTYWARKVDGFAEADAMAWAVVCDSEVYGGKLPKPGVTKPYRLPAATKGAAAKMRAEAVAEFEATGHRAGSAKAQAYDRALMALSREEAQGAVERMLEAELSVQEAANEEAVRLVAEGVRDDARDLGVELSEAYWRGVLRGAGARHDLSLKRGYAPTSHRRLPAVAGGGGFFGKLKRLLKH